MLPTKLQQVFHCTTCSRQFSNLAGLTSHLKSHEEKQFTCSSCEKQFYTKKRFDSHLKIGKCGIDDRKCQHCNKVYATPTALKLHMRKLRGKKVTTEKSFCNDIFSINESINESIISILVAFCMFGLQKGFFRT